MDPQISINPSQPFGGPSRNADPVAASGARYAGPSGSSENPTQKAESFKEGNPTVDRVSISEKGKAQKTDSIPKGNDQEGMLRSFESTPIRDSTISFKRTDNNQMIMLVRDSKTDKILKQYPPEEMQRISRAVEKFMEANQPSTDGKKIAGIA